MTPILLHSCCAPCSAAIIEWLITNEYRVSIIFFNPNIFPQEEYLKRKNEIIGYAKNLEIPIYDLDDDAENFWELAHKDWLERIQHIKGFATLPERSDRCLKCFEYRLEVTAQLADSLGIRLFTSTLASSRWKDLNQIISAGNRASSIYPSTSFWDKNWKKGGLYERRNLLAKNFYNQKYCGCEFSIPNK